MNVKFFVIILLLFQTREYITESINSWKSSTIPDNKTIKGFNQTGTDWIVFTKDNEVYVTNDRGFLDSKIPFKISTSKTEAHKFYGYKRIKEVHNGYLISFNHGEWGGYLYWFSKDGKQRYEISNDQVEDFFESGDRIFAIQGLAQINSLRGSIIEIKFENDKWTRELYQKLPSAPIRVVVNDKNEFVILTKESLIKINSEKQIDLLITDGFWKYYLHPTSLIIKESIAYIGMRNGILKYNFVSGEQEWIMRE